MKMFLLGMLVMWVVLNVMTWIMDFADSEYRFADLIRRGFPLCYVVTFLIQCLHSLIIIIPLLPLCVRYRINPFYTSISKVCTQLNTEKAREEWLKKIKKETEKNKWKKIFREFPLNTKEYLEELEQKKAEYEKMKERWS